MKNIYIAGGAGMLGEAFYKRFKTEFNLRVTDIDVNDDWISLLDFKDFEAYRDDAMTFDPDYLFHLGALTDLEYCEMNSDEAYATNTSSVENAVRIANELSIPLLYISTAGVFDGNKEVYDDFDIPSPVSHYARSKFLGEKYVTENMDQYLVCRAGWMMGGGPAKDKKFVGKILHQIRKGEKVLNVVNDKFGTPTYTHDFAENVRLLLEAGCRGVYNMVCEGSTNRMEVAKEIVHLLQMEDQVRINEVGSDFFSKEYFVARPRSEKLVNTKLKMLDLNKMRDWRVCLKEYIETYYADYLR